jgi:hypothetical protein
VERESREGRVSYRDLVVNCNDSVIGSIIAKGDDRYGYRIQARMTRCGQDAVPEFEIYFKKKRAAL